jgi:hypothetical protein
MHRWPEACLALLLCAVVGCAAPEPIDEYQDPPAARGLGEVIVENGCPQSIFRLRFALTDEAEWGADQLGDEVLKRGAKRTWYLPTGTYVVQAQLKDGSLVDAPESYTIAPGNPVTCTLLPKGAADMGTLTITNDTGFAIARLMFTLSSELGWGTDRLKTILAPSASQSWTIRPGRYNLKIFFQDGTSLEGADAYEVTAGEEAVYHLRSP